MNWQTIYENLQTFYFHLKNKFSPVTIGMHPSGKIGGNLDFIENRNYNLFDPIKRINWKLYARKEKLYVKEFERETNSSFTIIIDTSLSMKNKLELLKLSLFPLTFLFLNNKEKVKILTNNHKFSINSTSSFFEFINNFEHLNFSNSNSILNIVPKTTNNYENLLIFSDFAYELKNIKNWLKTLKNNFNFIDCFVLWNKEEIENIIEDNKLKDPDFNITISGIKKEKIRELLDNFLNHLSNFLLYLNSRMFYIDSKNNILNSLINYLKKKV